MSAERIRALGPDAVFLSNGPGDPAAVTPVIDAVRDILGEIPIFGICLGHQMLAQAAGLRTEKLPFGHRGANHPVRRAADDRVEVTVQNHGYAVVADALPDGVADHPHQPVRRLGRGRRDPRAAGVLGAVPPRGEPRAA